MFKEFIKLYLSDLDMQKLVNKYYMFKIHIYRRQSLYVYILSIIVLNIIMFYANKSLTVRMYSNISHIITNNQHELLRIYVNNYIERHIDVLLTFNPHDRIHYLQHNIVLNNRFYLNDLELRYVSKYIVSLNDSLINDITIDYKKKYPFGFYRFK